MSWPQGEMSEGTPRRPRLAHAWALILAGGEGSRVRSLTAVDGEPAPKQFCSLWGGVTMLGAALARAGRVVREDRVVPVVVRSHRRWWESELAGLPVENVIVQPSNRGTAAGILLPLLEVMARDPQATVAVLPSDHHFVREAAIRAALRLALLAVERDPRHVLLLGNVPDAADEGLGWIVPASAAELLEPAPVAEFREKPTAAGARLLLARGAVVNTFLFAARAASLLALYRSLLPDLTAGLEAVFRSTRAREELDRAYAELPSHDFSRELLQRATDQLAVLRVPSCGWTDLGTPQRIERCLADLRQPAPPAGRRRTSVLVPS